MAAAPTHSFVALILIACAAGAFYRALQPAPGSDSVELQLKEMVRVQGGQAVLVFEEKDGARKLPVPISKAEAALIERGLHGVRGLGPDAVAALGGRVLRASIDEVSPERGFRAHLFVGSGSRELAIEGAAGEALALALQSGAPIVVGRAVLDAAAIGPSELQRRTARSFSTERAPAPVLHI